MRLRRLLACAFVAASGQGCARSPDMGLPPEPERPWRVMLSAFSAPARLPRVKLRSANACVEGCFSGGVTGGSLGLGLQTADPTVAVGCFLASCLFAGGKFLFGGPEVTQENSPYTRLYVDAFRDEVADTLTGSRLFDAQADRAAATPPELIARWKPVERAEYMRLRGADALVTGEMQYMEEVVDATSAQARCWLRARVHFRVYARSGESLVNRIAEGETDPRLPVEALGTEEVARSAGRRAGEQLLRRLAEAVL